MSITLLMFVPYKMFKYLPVHKSSDFLLWLDLVDLDSDLVFFGLVMTDSSVSGAGRYLKTNKTHKLYPALTLS